MNSKKPTIEKPESGSSMHVLIVEDDEFNTNVLSRILKMLGHSYKSAVNGMEALELLRIQPFNVVLMDLQMPHMDGFETTRIIRQDPEYSGQSDIPIVALTAHAMNHHREKCQQVGMNDFIAKPVDIQRFKSVLETYCDTHNDSDNHP